MWSDFSLKFFFLNFLKKKIFSLLVIILCIARCMCYLSRSYNEKSLVNKFSDCKFYTLVQHGEEVNKECNFFFNEIMNIYLYFVITSFEFLTNNYSHIYTNSPFNE